MNQNSSKWKKADYNHTHKTKSIKITVKRMTYVVGKTTVMRQIEAYLGSSQSGWWIIVSRQARLEKEETLRFQGSINSERSMGQTTIQFI